MAASEGSVPTATMPASGGVLAPIRDTALSPVFAPPLGSALPGQADPLAGGIDYKRVWHSFRRRWMAATAAALALGALGGVLTWLFLPRGFEAVAWLQVNDKADMFSSGGGRDGGEYDSYRKTQVQLIKSPFVLASAIRKPGIASLSTLSTEKDPIGWLARNVQVTAPMESKVLQVRLSGENAADVTQIVNAITDAYISDVVNKEKTQRLQRRDMLERKYKENMAEVRSSLETYHNLAKSLGAADSAEVATQRSLLLDHLSTLRAQKNQAERDLVLIDAELAIIDAKDRGEIPLDEAVPEETIDALLQRDPQFAELRERLAGIQESITYQAERSARGPNDPAVRRLESLRAGMIERIEERRRELRPQVVAQLAAESSSRRTGAAVESPVVLRLRRALLAKQLDQASLEYEKVSAEVKLLGNANADLMARKQEIEQLMSVTDQMGKQLQATEVDVTMPGRVEVLEKASVPEGTDDLFRTMVSVLAAAAGLVLGGASVVAFDYLRDRVGSADEVAERVGLRVIGTVPRISRSRKQSNDGHVAECVDGVRAVIAQTGRESPKVILVTSAVEHEGKTTFASQLAASLARSGKRTLLLDGDLRHPNVHLALGIDLRAGLPELLRGEIGPDEAVQPTGIEGLFAVTGGACDYAAITALSRPDSAKIIAKYRESFDEVVIDAGPVLAFADVLILGQLSDVAIIATMRDSSRVPLVSSAVERLRSVGVRVLGTVVNGVVNSAPRRLYASPLPT